MTVRQLLIVGSGAVPTGNSAGALDGGYDGEALDFLDDNAALVECVRRHTGAGQAGRQHRGWAVNGMGSMVVGDVPPQRL